MAGKKRVKGHGRKRRAIRHKGRKKVFREVQTRSKILGQIIPEMMAVSMPYFDSHTLTGATIAEYQYQTSGFDPNATGVGHQPLGWDNWKTFYYSYRCMGVTGRIMVVNNGAVPVLIQNFNSELIAGSLYPAIMEQPGGKPSLLGLSGGGHDVKVLKMNIKPWKYLGISRKEYKGNNDLYAALNTSNPAKMVFNHFVANSVDNATNINISVVYDLVYHFELFDRVLLTGS